MPEPGIEPLINPGEGKPSDAVRAGYCPGCMGTGWVHRFVPTEHDGPCSTCHGDGRWPPADWRDDE